MTRSERWTDQAAAWSAWADERREDDILPPFHGLLPDAPARTLDLGCGEGRITRELRRCGHEAVGVDIAPGLIELARKRDPGGDYRVANAEALPFADGCFELVVAFNVLMSVDEPARALTETARVLADGGCLCASIVHPLASAGTWQDDAFVVHDYLAQRAYEDFVGGVVFANVHAPLERWADWLESAGLAVAGLQELPRTGVRGWNRLPMFLLLRAVKR